MLNAEFSTHTLMIIKLVHFPNTTGKMVTKRKRRRKKVELRKKVKFIDLNNV